MRPIKFQLLSIPVLVMMLAAALNPGASVRAQDTKGVLVPFPYSPHGTLMDKTPTYKWSMVTGATIYRYQVYRGTTKVLDKSPDSGVCGVDTCEKTPAFTLGYNLYKWRVRAYKGGYWSAWSPYMEFNVSPPGFTSSFNNEMAGWAKKTGKDWYRSATYIYTLGLADKWSSAYRTGSQYTDFTYKARMKRSSGYSPNYIVMRMGTNLSANGTWYPGYYFGFDNWGYALIWELNPDGSDTEIYSGTACLVNKFGWNTLEVKAIGWKFWFYVNGCLAHYFTDTTFPRGYVGIATYRIGTTAQTVYVDWANLTVLETEQ